MYTNSWYAFTTVHVHVAIYQERGLLTIKNKQEILNLLRALWLPKKLAVIHCPGHQRAETPITRGNQRANQATKKAALEATSVLAIRLPDQGHPHYWIDPATLRKT